MVNKKKKIAIFIPAYEHTKTLPSVLDRIPDEIKKKVEEIFVIDDASSDNTHLLAKGYKIEKKLDKLNVYKNEENKGYGGNQKRAYQYAIKKNYDVVVMLHGDGQYAPEFLPRILEELENTKADLLFGSRMLGNPLKGGMPIYKFLGNKFLTFMENLILRTNISEFHSGYRAYNVHALKKIPFHLNSDGFNFDPEIIIQFANKKLKIAEISIPTYYGGEISYVNVIQYGLNVLKSLLEYRLYKLGIIKSNKFG